MLWIIISYINCIVHHCQIQEHGVDCTSPPEQSPLPKTIRLEIEECGIIHTFPQVYAQIYPTKYDKPISVVAFFDIEARQSFLNPSILSEEYWVSFETKFKTTTGTIFNTHLITKHPATIQFFPACSIQTKLIRLELPSKDLSVGFDIYSQLKKCKLLPHGFQFKQHFQEYIDIPRLFYVNRDEKLTTFKTQLIHTFSAENYMEFLKKCGHLFYQSQPLWNESRFSSSSRRRML